MWNFCVQKLQWPRAEWRELPCKMVGWSLMSLFSKNTAISETTSMQDSAIQNICWKIFIQWRWHHFCSLSKRHLQWPTKKGTGRHCNKTPVHKISVQSQMASVGEPQVADSTPVWYLSITKAYYRNTMLLQQFPLAVLQISSKFFIF